MKITTENIQVGFHARQILKGISMESQDRNHRTKRKRKIHFAEMHLPYSETRRRSRVSGRRGASFHECSKLCEKNGRGGTAQLL